MSLNSDPRSVTDPMVNKMLKVNLCDTCDQYRKCHSRSKPGTRIIWCEKYRDKDRLKNTEFCNRKRR